MGLVESGSPKPLQPIQTVIQTQTNQTIQPQLKNTQTYSRVEVRQEELMRTGPATLARIKGWMEGYK